MKSNYKPIGDYIKKVENRNKDLKVTRLLGLSMTKEFRETTSNIIGTDMSVYRVMTKHQFACDFMSPIRVNKLPVVLKLDDEPNLVSPAYPVFEISDKNILDPEYLMMWFRRPEFDRYATFKCDAAIRGGYEWKELCETLIPVPSIIKQKEIVKEYNTIVNRIKSNQQLIQKLEETAQAIYKQWFVDFEFPDEREVKTLNDLCSLITDGKHGDCANELNSGYYFLSAKDLQENTLVFEDARQIIKKDFEETHRRTNLKPGDICMVNTGATIGRMSIAPDVDLTVKSTFQKSVAILKPRRKVATSLYLYCLLKNNIKEISELGSGTSQPNLLLGDLKKYIVLYPGYERILEFENKVNSIYKTQYFKTIENTLLIKFQNLLLSKLATIKN